MSGDALAKHFAMWLRTAAHICAKLEEEGRNADADALARAIDCYVVPFLATSIGDQQMDAACQEIELLDAAAAASVRAPRAPVLPNGFPVLPKLPSREQLRRLRGLRR